MSRRRRALTLGTAAAGALAAAVALGPRATVTPRLAPTAVPADPARLDSFLAAAEADVPALRPGTEKTIVWAGAPGQPTDVAVVYLHGFSATRQETAPLADSVAARLGANLYYARLAGHGQDAEALGRATANDWLADAHEALGIGRRLGRRVVLIGTSTGGTLATWLAVQDTLAAPAALVLISPNFAPKDPNAGLLLWPWGRLIARAAVGPYRAWRPHNPAQARYWTTRYRTEALLSMMGLVDLVARADLGALRTPVLVLYDPADRVVDAEATEARFAGMGAPHKRLVRVVGTGDPSHHVLAGAVLSPQTTPALTDTIVAFVERYAGAPPG